MTHLLETEEDDEDDDDVEYLRLRCLDLLRRRFRRLHHRNASMNLIVRKLRNYCKTNGKAVFSPA